MTESQMIAAALRRRALAIREAVDGEAPRGLSEDNHSHLVALMMVGMSEEFDKLADELAPPCKA